MSEDIESTKTESCSWCKTIVIPEKQRFCFRCEKTTCRSKTCGAFSIPKLTGENQVWVCQECTIEAIAQSMKADSSDSSTH